MSHTVLIVEDEAPLRASMSIALRRAKLEVVEAHDLASARLALDEDVFDLVLSDLKLPDGDGIELLRYVRKRAPETSVVIVTAYGTIETAVEAMQEGALDFIQKPFGPDRLVMTARRALEHSRLAARLRRLERDRGPAFDLVGVSAPMRRVRESIARAGGARTVLILGRTGTGKELVARSVHGASSPDRPFVVVNCATLGESLLESELFGHVPGSFTGASAGRRGLLAEADGGTVFFDEIGELPLPLQAKLLRFIQFGELRPVGSNRTTHVEAKVIAATNRNLATEVSERRFREDLYYRLDVFRIELPALIERLDDLPELCQQLASRIARALHRPPPRLAPGLIDHLRAHDWPGNVRELENALERGILHAADDELRPEHIALPSGPARATEGPTLAELEKQHILRAVEASGGDRQKASRRLGISRSTLRRKLIEYGAWAHDDEEDGP